MSTIITSRYKTLNSSLMLDEIVNNDYYIFISTILEEDNIQNSEKSKKDFLSKTLFGKKISQNDVFFMIENNIWQSNTIFLEYDDSKDMSDNNFYCVVYPNDSNTGEYLVFKCLSNNYNSKSMTAPQYNENLDSQIYFLDDGYIWKFIYKLSSIEFDKYAVYGYVPIIEANIIDDNNSPLEQIFVENHLENNGYSTVSGVVKNVFSSEQEILITSNSDVLSQTENYYLGQSFYVTNQSLFSRIYKIIDYKYNSLNDSIIKLEISAEKPFEFIDQNCTFQITPRIDIRGNGIGAEALPVVVDGAINKIRMITLGEGYTDAAASVVDPLYNFNPESLLTIDKRAVLRPIISYKSGSQYDIKNELLSKNAMIFARIEETDNIDKLIPTSNTYTKIGLVKNPEFNVPNPTPAVFDNRIRMNIIDHIFTVGDNIIQTDMNGLTTFSGVVHAIENDDVYVAEYMGTFRNMISQDTSFDQTKQVRNQNNATYNINTNMLGFPDVTTSKYKQRTGAVLYMSDLNPILRSENNNEQYKIILRF